MKNWILSCLSIVFVVACGDNDRNAAQNNPDQQQIMEKLTAELKQYPDSAGLRMRLINSLDSLQMYKEAIAQADSLIKKDSANNGLWVTKAQLEESNKDTAAAIKSYMAALRVYPSVEAQLNLANIFAESRNPQALVLCNNVHKMGLGRETDADCNFIAGIFYARTGQSKQALELFDKAINDNYTLMEAYMEKGFVYYDNKRYAEAVEVFERAITVNKMYADAYYWKAKCEESLGNKEEAIINYKRSLGLDKELKEAAEAIKRLE